MKTTIGRIDSIERLGNGDVTVTLMAVEGSFLATRLSKLNGRFKVSELVKVEWHQMGDERVIIALSPSRLTEFRMYCERCGVTAVAAYREDGSVDRFGGVAECEHVLAPVAEELDRWEEFTMLLVRN